MRLDRWLADRILRLEGKVDVETAEGLASRQFRLTSSLERYGSRASVPFRNVKIAQRRNDTRCGSRAEADIGLPREPLRPWLTASHFDQNHTTRAKHYGR